MDGGGGVVGSKGVPVGVRGRGEVGNCLGKMSSQNANFG
jgi:hypothetical protein